MLGQHQEEQKEKDMHEYELYVISSKLAKHSSRIEGLLGQIEERDDLLLEQEVEIEMLRRENKQLKDELKNKEIDE